MEIEKLEDDFVVSAISRRTLTIKKEITLYVILSTIIFCFGIALVFTIFLYFNDDETELVKQFVGIGTGALTTGMGGALAKRALDLRSWIATGNDWQKCYLDALGPPPEKLLSKVEEKVIGWLEGK